jgi:hypothetical protein
MQSMTTSSTLLQGGFNPALFGSASTGLAINELHINIQQNPFFEFKNVMRIFCPSQLQKALEQSNVVLWNAGTGRIDALEMLLPDYQVVGISDLSPMLAKNKNEALSSSLHSHPPHQDGVYRHRLFDLVALQNVMTDNAGGGFGLFWNMRDMLLTMPKEYYNFLKNNIIQYRRLRNDASGYDTYEGTMIHTNADDSEVIHWRYDTQVRPELLNEDKEAQRLFEKSCAWVLNFLCTHLPDVVPYQEGDFVLMKNSIFHGRTALSSANRYVRRVWFDKKLK